MARTRSLLPFAAALLGVAVFSAMDAAMKQAAILAGVYSALVLRNLAGVCLILPVWLAGRPRLPRGPALGVHVLRSAVVAAMAPLFFWAIVRLPLAEVIALSFIAPLIAVYLAALMLGETVRPTAVLASLLGLAGVAVIAWDRLGDMSSHGSDETLGVAAVLASAMLYALNLVLQRRQALIAGPIEIAMFQNLLTGLILAAAAPWLFAVPGSTAIGAILVSAALAVAALLLLSWAYARAEAQVLVPTEYTGFLWAALLGWWWFGEALEWKTLAGALLIVAGCLVAARQRTEQTAL